MPDLSFCPTVSYAETECEKHVASQLAWLRWISIVMLFEEVILQWEEFKYELDKKCIFLDNCELLDKLSQIINKKEQTILLDLNHTSVNLSQKDISASSLPSFLPILPF